MRPERDDIPESYVYLIEWYLSSYCKTALGDGADAQSASLEIPMDIYKQLSRQADLRGCTVREAMLAYLPGPTQERTRINPAERPSGDIAELMRFAGVLDSGDARSAENDRVDADLHAYLRSEHVA